MKIWIVIVMLSLVAVSCSKDQTAKAPKKSKAEMTVVPVKVQPVSLKPYREFGEYYGTVQGLEEAHLIAYAGGRVAKITVNLGDKVKAGQKLCEIDGEQMEIALKSAKLAEQIAKQNYDRAKLHLKRGSTSKLNADRAHLEYLGARSKNVNAKKSFDGAFCVSPIDGIVVAKYIELHRDLTPGQPTMSIAALDKVKVVVGVPEAAIDGYSENNEVEVHLNNHPGKSWSGKIHSIARSVDQKDRTFEVKVLVENPQGLLRPGLTARTRMLRYSLDSSIVIPTEVILTKVDGRVVMVAENGVAKARKIIVRSSNETESLVESGIAKGEQIIVKGQAIAVDGSPLKIVD